MQRLIALATLLLAGCALAPPPSSPALPELTLSPASLGRTLNLQQHLTLQAPGREQQLDVLLEADAQHVQLGLLAMGAVGARLDWDGKTLKEDKASWWPAAVTGQRVLSDLQLTLWPVAAIQAALPAGWRLTEAAGVRTLAQDGEVVAVITRTGPQDVELDQRREHFKLRIQSVELGGEPAFLP